jgi:hypothetical protein
MKQKISFGSSKYNFEVCFKLSTTLILLFLTFFFCCNLKHSILNSTEQLSKFFDINQLTIDLDGTMPYNNEQWIEFRIVS